MKKFSVSAPGKLIFTGEHSVVFGFKAVAISLDCRVVLEVQESYQTCNDDNANSPIVQFELSDIEESISIYRHEVEKMLGILAAQSPNNKDNEAGSVQQNIALFRASFSSLSGHSSLSSQRCELLRAVCIYLLCRAVPKLMNNSNTHANTRSLLNFRFYSPGKRLPISSGLGSSASLCVCLAGALLLLNHIQQQNQQQIGSTREAAAAGEEAAEFIRQNRSEISRLAFLGECVFHGSPSGVDNTVAAFGGAVVFKKGTPVEMLDMNAFLERYASQQQYQQHGDTQPDIAEDDAQFRILLVNSKIERSTKSVVQFVRNQFERSQTHTKLQGIFKQIDALSERLAHLIGNPSCQFDAAAHTPAHTAAHKVPLSLHTEISRLLQRNQTLLTQLGVSHPKIDWGIQLLEELQPGLATCAKLSGAGWGGMFFALLPPGMPHDRVQLICRELTQADFDVQLANLGADGVQLSSWQC